MRQVVNLRFETLLSYFLKTIAWFLGDLDYNETFLNSALKYKNGVFLHPEKSFWANLGEGKTSMLREK